MSPTLTFTLAVFFHFWFYNSQKPPKTTWIPGEMVASVTSKHWEDDNIESLNTKRMTILRLKTTKIKRAKIEGFWMHTMSNHNINWPNPCAISLKICHPRIQWQKNRIWSLVCFRALSFEKWLGNILLSEVPVVH